MKDMDRIVKSAMTLLLTLSAAGTLLASSQALADQPMEKCYGIVKAGMNDCQTKTAKCAGSSTTDSTVYILPFTRLG